MENFELGKEKCSRKESCLKYAVIFFATIIGAFLAFYFVADFTIKSMLNPEHQMRRAEKMMRDMDRQMAREFNKDIAIVGKMVPNPVNIMEKDNSYIIKIALKPFGNTAKNLKVSFDDDNNVLKIEGSNDVKKGDKENMMNMVQSYKLPNKVEFDKMTTKEERGHYIVTIPFDVD